MQNFSKLILPSVRGFGKKTFFGIGPEFKQADLKVLYFIALHFFFFLHFIHSILIHNFEHGIEIDNHTLLKCLCIRIN